jgi:hypothetical protein
VPTLSAANPICTAQNSAVRIKVNSASCQADPCTIRFQKGRRAYFEIHPVACKSDSSEFSIQVLGKSASAKPKLTSCDGNASCPKAFSKDGVASISLVQGKTWGMIQY